MNEKFTPGPWKIEPSTVGTQGYVGIGTANGGKGYWSGLAEVVTKMVGFQEDCADGSANANLIAAAPELYGALKALVDWPLSGPEPARLWDNAKEALAKARGE